MSNNGCSWVAPYNIGIMLGVNQKPADIIKYFETRGETLVNGKFGVNPLGVYNYLKYIMKLKPKFYSDIFNNRLDSKIRKTEAAILCYWTGSTGHYVAINWNNNTKKFYIYNDGEKDTGIFTKAYEIDSIDKWLNDSGNAWQIVLITINK